MTTQTKRQRVLHDLTIDKIAAVDRPCQEHARMTIMKRDSNEEYDKMQLQKIDRDAVASFDTFEQAVGHLEKVTGSRAGAMRAAGRQYPQLVRKFNQDGDEIAKAAVAARKARAAPQAVAAWDVIVGGIQARDGVTRSAAMSTARKENPAAFAAMQAAS